jgi:hypothetical protein
MATLGAAPAGIVPSGMDLTANLGPQLNGITWFLFGSATVFMTLRLYCKFLNGRGFWWDDYVLVLSWVCPQSPSHNGRNPPNNHR